MERVNRGKKLLIAVIAICLGYRFIGLLSVFVYYGIYSIFVMWLDIFIFALHCLFFWFMYTGSNGARIIALIFAGYTVAIAFFGAFLGVLGIQTLLVIVLNGFCFIALVSEPVKAYQYYKRTGNINPPELPESDTSLSSNAQANSKTDDRGIE